MKIKMHFLSCLVFCLWRASSITVHKGISWVMLLREQLFVVLIICSNWMSDWKSRSLLVLFCVMPLHGKPHRTAWTSELPRLYVGDVVAGRSCWLFPLFAVIECLITLSHMLLHLQRSFNWIKFPWWTFICASWGLRKRIFFELIWEKFVTAFICCFKSCGQDHL